jgi:hypothetical protein
VHDNLDVEHLGHTPKDMDLDFTDWDQVTWSQGEQVRLMYRLKALNAILFKPADRHQLAKQDQRSESCWSHSRREADRGPSISPAEITNSLLQFSAEINQKSSQWMQEHPFQKLPVNYAMFPGKMDHCTCITIRVGSFDSQA